MEPVHFQKVLDEIKDLRVDMNNRLDKLERELRSEMEIKHQGFDYTLNDYNRRISFTEKILLTTGGAILLAVLYAVLNLIGL